MTQQLVIHLSNHAITAYATERRTVSEVLRLPTQNREYSKFEQFLEDWGGNQVRLVIDLKEELIHYETIPHLSGNDRKALLERKIRQIAGNSNYSSVLTLGRDKDGRKDDRILISAIPQPEGLQPWLDCLFRRRIAICGMFSAAVICQRVVKNLLKDRDILLISTSASGGGKLAVRQSFYRDGKLILSRLSLAKKSASMTSDIYKEINRTRSYLLRAHSLNHGKELTVLFVTDPEYVDDANAQRAELIQIQLNVYTYDEFAKQLDILSKSNPVDFEAIIAHQTAQLSRFKTQYSNKDTRFYYWHHRAKQSMQVASLAFLLGAVTYASACWFEIQQTRSEIADIQVELGQIKSKLNDTPRSELIKGYSPKQIDSYIRADDILKGRLVVPAAVLNSISMSLAGIPAIRLNSVNWSRDPGNESNQRGASASFDAEDLGLDGDDFDDLGLAEEGSQMDSVVYAKITGEVIPFEGNYRNAHRNIEALVASLNRQVSVQSATATRLPMDTRPTVDISGEMRPAENIKDSATFTVEAVIDYSVGY